MKERIRKMKYNFGETLKDHTLRLGTIRTIQVVGVVDFDRPGEMVELPTDFYMPGKGYLDLSTNCVWIYSLTPYPKNQGVHYPYFWFEEDRVKVTQIDEEMFEKANVENIRCMDIHELIERVPENQTIMNDRIQELVSSGASMVLPVVKVKDDALKKMVKSELREIMMSISMLPIIDTKHQVANMRSALLNDTKMSVPYFHKWRELMGRDAYIVTANKEPDTDGSYHALVYTDSRDMIGHMPDEVYEEFLKLIPECKDDERIKALALISPEEDEKTDPTEVLYMSDDDPEASAIVEESKSSKE